MEAIINCCDSPSTGMLAVGVRTGKTAAISPWVINYFEVLLFLLLRQLSLIDTMSSTIVAKLHARLAHIVVTPTLYQIQMAQSNKHALGEVSRAPMALAV